MMMMVMMMMNDQEIEDICTDRLGRWQKRLVEQHSTPVLTLGVGHDHKEGQVTLCTTEDVTDDEVIIFLEGTIKILKQQGGGYGETRRN